VKALRVVGVALVVAGLVALRVLDDAAEEPLFDAPTAPPLGESRERRRPIATLTAAALRDRARAAQREHTAVRLGDVDVAPSDVLAAVDAQPDEALVDVAVVTEIGERWVHLALAGRYGGVVLMGISDAGKEP
jgi:hypothetical protein